MHTYWWIEEANACLCVERSESGKLACVHKALVIARHLRSQITIPQLFD